MSQSIDRLNAALARGLSVRPKVGGFPGVVRYRVYFEAREVSYRGARDEEYTESYAAVTIE